MRFDVLYRELSHGVDVVRALVSGVSQEEARMKPAPDAWSILEVVGHLDDEERDDFRTRLDIVLHWPNTRWPAIDPTGWVVARRYNERDLTATLESLIAERNRSLAWLEGLTSPKWDASYHASFGTITAGDLLASWVAHDNLHTRQLVELKRHRIVRITEPYAIRYAGDW